MGAQVARWGKKATTLTPSAVPRSIEQLHDVDQPAWQALREAIEAAQVSVVLLPADAERAGIVLHRLQVSTASTLGALAAHCGGLLVDHGWLRILGGGCGELPDLAEANLLPRAEQAGAPPQLVVAYDVLGGVFTIDGGGLGVAAGEVCYCGPDTLSWEALGTGHSGFVYSALAGDLGDFFGTQRWPGWERDVEALTPGLGLSLYPPPFTRQGQDIAAVSRRPVPFSELLDFYGEMAAQLAGIPDGQSVSFRVTE